MNRKSLVALAALAFMFATGFWGIKSKGTDTEFTHVTSTGVVVTRASHMSVARVAGSGICSVAVYSRALRNTSNIDTVYFAGSWDWEKGKAADSLDFFGIDSAAGGTWMLEASN